MSDYQIFGGEPLKGTVHIQGSKNAALPLIAASLLHSGTTVFYGCPNISDVHYMLKILKSIGCDIEWKGNRLSVEASEIHAERIVGECVGKMRSSILLLGALIGRCQEVALNYPGGCNIGERPIDIHLNALKKMGIQVKDQDNYICCCCRKLKSSCIVLPYPSVGATENILMAAVYADGVTCIYNAAMEPEITELVRFLKKMGVVIHGEGTRCIRILGRCALKDCEYSITGDRIVAGTYLLAAAGTRGRVEVCDVIGEELQEVMKICQAMGCKIKVKDRVICLECSERLLAVEDIHTAPYPGVPTDLQSLLMSVLTLAKGETRIYEHIFENRFQIASELGRMGADIHIHQHRAVIRGVKRLNGSLVNACDLRGGAALILAGLMAEGKTIVKHSVYVERGYQDICKDLRELGANISIINNKE